MNKHKIKFLDGGMLFELNKQIGDLGNNAILNDQVSIINIYKDYINLSCNYITTCNYGYKSLKYKNWKELIDNTYNLFKYIRSLKINNNNYNILCSLPPYYESYQNGLVNDKFIEYYTYIIKKMDSIIDYYIIETSVSHLHVEKILDLIKTYSNRKTIVSIYPNGFINKKHIEDILNKFELYGLLLNCCDYNTMIKYFIKNIISLNIPLNTKLGFYCNMINEMSYNIKDNKEKKSCVDLQCFKNDKIINMYELEHFFKKYNKKNELIIGGCCGYGVKEMALLLNYLKYFSSAL